MPFASLCSSSAVRTGVLCAAVLVGGPLAGQVWIEADPGRESAVRAISRTSPQGSSSTGATLFSKLGVGSATFSRCFDE